MEPAADILSNLPDEILHRILKAADLDLKSLARTSVLSKRWRHLWKSSLTKLHLPNIPLKLEEWGTFSQFIEKILSFRNDTEDCADLDSISLITDGKLRPHMFPLLEKIFVHGVENRVRTFRFGVGSGQVLRVMPPGLNALWKSVENLELSLRMWAEVFSSSDYSAVRTLRLYRCVLILPPLERALEFAGVRWIQHITLNPNMTKLELIECDFFRCKSPVQISSSQLIDLVIVWPREADSSLPPDMIICAPQIKSFTCKEIRLYLVQSLKLPSLEYLDIDVFLHNRISDSSEMANEASLEVFRFFQSLEGLKHVKLHPSTILALIMVPGLLEMQESPFKSVECVEFHSSGSLISNRRIFNALVSYFFNDCIRGTALFDRIFAQPGTGHDSSSRPMVVYKHDLLA